jgi:putative glycosyltransferase (TIGR04372 family)
MFATAKSRLIKYFFFGNSITNDGYLRLAYLLGRFLVFLPLSLCATLVLGIYSLFRPVKIFMLRCERSKISFIVEDLEVALRIEAHKEKTTGVRRPFMFAVLDCESPNRAFTSMYGRVVPFLDADRPFSRGVIRYALPIFRLRRQYLECWQSENQMEVWRNQKPSISFTLKDQKIGKDLEHEFRFNTVNEFVCIGLPEKIYYETKFAQEHGPSINQDLFTMMPSWETYLPSTIKLAESGLDVLRMGQFVEQPISRPKNEGVIDYASLYRSEFGDVWLLGNCKFAISGNGTGFYWVSKSMNRPVVITDSPSPCKTSYGKNDIHIPLLAWSRENRMLKPFSWLISKGEAWATNRELIEGDIEIVKNTAEEITEVVLEMNQRIDGTWVETDEDIELQERFKKLRQGQPPWKVQQSVRIGAAFLRRYKHLL